MAIQGQVTSSMLLDRSLDAWGSSRFENVLKMELAQQAGLLPLQQGLAIGNYVADAPVTVLVHSVTEQENTIRVKVGIFYQGVIGGCSCEDDPTPSSDINEYCEVMLEIDKSSAIATVNRVTE